MKKHLQYEGPVLEELLDRVRQRHGADAMIVRADKDRTGGIAGFFSREVFHVVVAVDDADDPENSLDDDPDGDDALWSIVASAAAASSTTGQDGADFAATLGRILDEGATGPPVVAQQAPHVVPRPVDPVPVEAPALRGVETVSFPHADQSHAPTEVPPEAHESRIRLRPPTPPPVVDVDDAGTVVALSSRRIQRQVECSESFDELLLAFESAQSEPTELPQNGIVAVVGSLAEAEPLAATMMEVAGGTAEDLLILSPTDSDLLPSAAEIIGVAAQLRARRGLSIVVVELQPGLEGHMWVTQMLAHLSAHQVRLVIGAGRSAEGATVAVQALARIDVLDLVDVHEISEPERFLELGVPVGSLDSRTPTPALWAAAAVTARVAASAREAVQVTPGASAAE